MALHHGNILLPANLSPPGKWHLKRREKAFSFAQFRKFVVYDSHD